MRHRRSLTLATLFTLVGVSVQGGSWPQFRGPGGDATAEAAAPISWSEAENILWKSPLPGRGASSPIVANGRVFVTAYTGYGLTASEPGDKKDLRLHVLCFDAKTGAPLWDKSHPGGEYTQQATERVVDHGFATGTPAADDVAVYAHFGVNGLVAYDYDGNQLWQAEVGDKTTGFGSASSPVVFENHVFVNASIESGKLYAFDKQTGKVDWEFGPVERSWATPHIAERSEGGHELVLNMKDRIVGLDPATGETLWTCVGIDDYVVPTPVSHDGVVYCLGGRGNRAIAVRLGGRGDVTETHRLWNVNVGANVTSPVWHEGRLHWASDRGVMNGLDAATGETVYRERLPTSERIYGSVVLAGDRLYITTRDKGTVVLKAGDSYEELARNEIETGDALVNASPAIADGRIYLRTDSHLYCVGQPTAE